ncbi:MAG: DUF6689 family protein [Acidobacteriota bacterium]|nr:DUF6689 family protein [Acidobacteriota bacterium]
MANSARSVLFAIVLATLAFGASTASGQGIQNLQINGQEVTADIVLPGLSAELHIVFENATGLTPANLGLSAQLVNPLDLGLLARLPTITGLLPSSNFPVLLTLDPPPASTLSMNGVVTVEIYTTDLLYLAGTLLRLYAATPSGSFEDVTAWMSSGSFRVGAVHPEFAREHLIVLDPRPVEAVVNQQLTALESTLAAQVQTINPTLWGELDTLLEGVHDEVLADDPEAALELLDDFSEEVVTHSGQDIPDQWVAGGSLTNVAGELRANAARLAFSLQRQADGGLF